MKRLGDAVTTKYIEVYQRNDEPAERLIKRFTKKVRDEGILREHMDSLVFVKPTDARRKKKNLAKWTAKNITRK